MMVIFVSQCEKNALPKTRRVLDAFANRIGDNTWRTVITEEGLKTVKKMLRQTASKSTAVACHWIRSRSRSQLVWIVGNRKKFDENGVVPVNYTEKDIPKYENDWHYLPVIKALTAISALFHDWGKATVLFQNKLKNISKQGDPLRHEWISCLLFTAFVKSCGTEIDDIQWLYSLSEGNIDETSIIKSISPLDEKPFRQLPPVANIIIWLIVSHHRMPFIDHKIDDYRDEPAINMESVLKWVGKNWGYENRHDENEYQRRLKDCFKFDNGLMTDSVLWLKQLKKWSQKLIDCIPMLNQLISDGSIRVVLYYARLCLMLGDHCYSSQDANTKWSTITELFANTDPKTRILKQKLDEHLVGVMKRSIQTSHLLPRFEHEPPVADDIIALKKSSPKEFAWQNKAVDRIKKFRTQQGKKRWGFFAVNIASTGCGKTFANAKIMRELSNDGESFRYILALGLRTLTLQTGDEYRKRIGLDNSELAVLIGSKAVMELHNNKVKEEDDDDDYYNESGSESLRGLLDEDFDYDCNIPEEGLVTILRKQRDRQFLYAPVLACTIDHIISSTESVRGGRHILPGLRLMSSDLVIDEVDDFTGKDLVAIGRLIHLSGMLGRKVMISSATIPPDLAEGFFCAYHAGWQIYCQTRDVDQKIGCAWIDEFKTDVFEINNKVSKDAVNKYRDYHQKFIDTRVENLSKQPVKRKSEYVECQSIIDDHLSSSDESKQNQYIFKIQQAILENHQRHFICDKNTGINVSFGLVRIANILPCVTISKTLMKYEWPADTDVRIMSYHSQQVMLLRHEQERHLDMVLKRKDASGFDNPVIKHHLEQSNSKNMIFILVATPVEEIGRDHDFDWAVVEPSSFRSIIQLAGRVRRHRNGAVDSPNISLLQYNWRTIRSGNQPGERYFYHPGYEEKVNLITHDLCQLIKPEDIANGICAIPRIKRPDFLDYRNYLIDLEHWVIHNQLTDYSAVGPEKLQGYLTGYWFLTALPQMENRFREGEQNTKLFWMYDSQKERCVFIQKDDTGTPVERENILNIICCETDKDYTKSEWLLRDYEKLLSEYASQYDTDKKEISLRFGELSFIYREGKEYEYSDYFGLVEKERREYE